MYMKKVWMMMLCFLVSVAIVNAQDAKQQVAPTPTPKVTKPAPLPGSQLPAQQAEAGKDATDKPVGPDAGIFKFKEETHDFGEVPDGPKAEYDFEFRNVGKSPIVITEAHGSCGCTVPEWPKEPIKPKHKGKIHVTYNTAGRVGPINKDVTITSNAQQSVMKLHITGMVMPKPEEPKPVSAPPPPPPPPPAK